LSSFQVFYFLRLPFWGTTAASDPLPISLGGEAGWGSIEEAPDVCFLRRFLVLISFVMSTPLLPRDRARRLRRDQTDAEHRLSDGEALMETEAVLTEIQNRL
jgi:hypothetical protein